MHEERRHINVLLEPLFATAILSGICYAMWFLSREYFLPQPFFYAVDDTFMDWFNVSYWANNGGAYEVFNSIYPPISFAFLDFFSLQRCYVASTPGLARLCDWVGLVTLHAFFVLNLFLIAKTYIKLDRRTALYRSIAAGAGLPMLYALNRGQLLIVCFTFIALGFGNILKSARLRWLATAVAINFKPYLITAVFPHLLKQRWSRFEGCILAVVAVYGVTWVIVGEGSPLVLFRNIQDFAGFYQAVNFLDLWYSGTYIPLVSLAQGPFPLTNFIGSSWVEFIETFIPLILRLAQSLVASACIWSFFRPNILHTNRLALLAIGFVLISYEAGGYTHLILLYFVLMERWESRFQKIAITLAYILAIPADITFGNIPPIPNYSYFGQRPVYLQFSIGIGSLVRPGLVQLMLIMIALDSIRMLWNDWRLGASDHQSRPLPSGAA